MLSFFDKLEQAVARTDSLLCVGLDPDLRHVPQRFHTAEDPVLAWNKAIIESTLDLACVYKPNLAFYEAMGRRGFELLRATRDAIPPEIPVILDAKRGDIGSTGEAYAQAIFDVWGVDAVTVTPYMGGDSLEPFFRRPGKGVFVLAYTSNPGAADLQKLVIAGRPLYEIVVEQAKRWNVTGNVGLVVGATVPEQLEVVRGLAPDMWILAPGIGAQGGNLEASLAAGLTTSGSGLLISVSRSLAQAPDMHGYAQELAGAISVARHFPTRSSRVQPETERLALALHAAGCIQFGDFTLHSGKHSPIYIDLRLLVSNPAALRLATEAYSRLLSGLSFDRIAAIPYAALPMGTAAALALEKPLIYPRKETKAYGTSRAIEGHYRAGERVVVLDDLITNGESKLEAIAPLEAAGLQVRDIAVLIDRQQGGAEQLAARGYHLHAVMGIGELLDILRRHERITATEYGQVIEFLGLRPSMTEEVPCLI